MYYMDPRMGQYGAPYMGCALPPMPMMAPTVMVMPVMMPPMDCGMGMPQPGPGGPRGDMAPCGRDHPCGWARRALERGPQGGPGPRGPQGGPGGYGGRPGTIFG